METFKSANMYAGYTWFEVIYLTYCMVTTCFLAKQVNTMVKINLDTG
jgi:hypothetical protein